MDPGSRTYTPSSTPTSDSPSTPTLTPASSLPQPVSVAEYLEQKDLQFLSSLVPTLCYIVLLMLCGLVGNTVVFVVYYRRFKPSVTRTYILAMSVCDLLTNVLSLPADIVEVRFHNTFTDPWLCKTFRTVKSFLGFLSACVLVAVAVDRHQTICNPRSKPAKIRTIYFILVISVVLAMAITAPYSVLTGRQTVEHPDTNITGSRCSIDDAFVKSRFLFVYNLVTGLVFVVCMALMVVSYVRIARQLWLHKKHTTVTGRAVGADSGTGPALHVTHTYIDEETCADGVQLSTDGRGREEEEEEEETDLREEDVSSHRPGQGHPDVLTTSASDAALALEDYTNMAVLAQDPDVTRTEDPEVTRAEDHDVTRAEDPDVTRAEDPDVTRAEDPDVTRAEDPDVIDLNPCSADVQSGQRGRALLNGNGKDGGTTTPSPCKVHPSYSDSRLPSCDVTTPEAKQPGHSSVMSRIRRTASDAKSFITRHKSTSKPRGSVKKIPTRTTFMMFVLTVVFIINYLPYLLLVSIRSRLGMESLVRTFGLNGYHICLRSYFINCAVNPLVYSFCSARFRRECRRLFHCNRR